MELNHEQGKGHDANRLVVIKPGALGDTLLTAPCLRAVREGNPDIRIVFIGTMPYANTLRHLGVADHIISFDRYHLFSPNSLDSRIVPRSSILAFIREPDMETSAWFMANGAERVSWKPSIPLNGKMHVVEYLYECLCEMVPNLGRLSQKPFRVQSCPPILPSPYVVVSPGAGGEKKRMPLETFVNVAETCSGIGLAPLFLAGGTEVENGLLGRFPAKFPSLVSPELDRLAAVLAGAEKVFANDSGVAHLAALVGTETHVFFGPTDPLIWRPWGERVVVWQGQSHK